MTDSTATLSSCQANVLGISRHRDYYRPHALWDADLKLMHRVNKLHMGIPFASNRILLGLLVQEGFKVGRMHVAMLMKRMRIEALDQMSKT